MMIPEWSLALGCALKVMPSLSSSPRTTADWWHTTVLDLLHWVVQAVFLCQSLRGLIRSLLAAVSQIKRGVSEVEQRGLRVTTGCLSCNFGRVSP